MEHVTKTAAERMLKVIKEGPRDVMLEAYLNQLEKEIIGTPDILNCLNAERNV